MTEIDIRRKVKNFIKKYSVKDTSYSTLCDVAERLGYTVVEYNRIQNEAPIDMLIGALSIKEQLLGSHGLTYHSEEHRIIFIDEKLNDDEKAIVLSHELGHIHLEHMGKNYVLGQDVIEEYNANQFSSILLNYKETDNKRKLVVAVVGIVACVAALLVSAAWIKRAKQYEEEKLANAVTETPIPTLTPTPTLSPTPTIEIGVINSKPRPRKLPQYVNEGEVAVGEFVLQEARGKEFLKFDTDWGPEYFIDVTNEIIMAVSCDRAKIVSTNREGDILRMTLVSTELPCEFEYVFDMSLSDGFVYSNEDDLFKVGGRDYFYKADKPVSNTLCIFTEATGNITFDLDNNKLVYSERSYEIESYKVDGDELNLIIVDREGNLIRKMSIDTSKEIGRVYY